MQIVARIEYLDQIGPDDCRVRPRTKVFESTATVDEIHTWANTIQRCPINDVTITVAE